MGPGDPCLGDELIQLPGHAIRHFLEGRPVPLRQLAARVERQAEEISYMKGRLSVLVALNTCIVGMVAYIALHVGVVGG